MITWRNIKKVLWGLIGLTVFAAILLVAAIRFNNGQLLSVQTGSMAPALKNGDMLIVLPTSINEIHRGDVITFHNPSESGQTITHRVINTPSQLNKPEFQTKGDANNLPDVPIEPGAIVGRAAYALPMVGHIVDFVRKPMGLTLVVYVPALIIILTETRRIVRYYTSSQKKNTARAGRAPVKGNGPASKNIAICISAVSLSVLLFAGAGLAWAALTSRLTLTGNRISADAAQLPVCYVWGELEVSQTWEPDCVYIVGNVAINDGITLTVESDVIIKVASGAPTGINVNHGGSLYVNGSSSKPVIFTSAADDSAGGDSNGNGGDGPPTAYDYDIAVLDNGGPVEIRYADFRYSKYSLQVGELSGRTVFNDNTFGGGVYLSARAPNNLEFLRNRFDVHSAEIGLAVSDTDLTAIPVTGPDRNVFAGGMGPGTTFVSSTSWVPDGSSWMVDAGGGIRVFRAYQTRAAGNLSIGSGMIVDVPGGCNGNLGFIVNPNGMLTLHAGVKVKTGAHYVPSCGGNTAFANVDQGGSLNAEGTAQNPVIFTSGFDDSVGGDTDGLDLSPTGWGYEPYGGIGLNGGSVTIRHTVFHYCQNALWNVDSPGRIELTDSSLDCGVSVDSRTKDTLIMKRNNFSVAGHGSISASQTDLSAIPLTGPDRNTFFGSSAQGGVISAIHSTVPEGRVWTVDTGGDLRVLRVNEVSISGEMTVGEGVVAKIEIDSGGFTVNQGGSLHLLGTESHRIVITSIHDNSFGGNTDGNGIEEPINISHRSAITNANGTVDGGYVIVAYAKLGISTDLGRTALHHAELWNGETAVANSSGETVLTGTGIHGFQYGVAVGEGSVLFRGSFDHITSKAVASCNWDLLSTIPCAVDASYSYWGSDQGPEALTCGVVITSPWLKGGGQQISDGSAWSGGNCDDSATAAAQLAEKEKTFREQFDALGIQCGGNPSIQEACDKQAQLFGCMDAGVAVLKNHLGDSFDWLPGFVAGKFVEKIIDGSGSMIKGMVKNDISRIEDNKAVFDSLAASTKLYFELNDTYNTCIAP